MPATAAQSRRIAMTLDAAMTRLVEEGPDYLATAEAVLDAAAERLSAHAVYVGKHVARDPRHTRTRTK